MKRNRDDLGQDRIRIRENADQVSELHKRELKHSKGFSPLVILAVIWIVLVFFSMFFVVAYDPRYFVPAYYFEQVTLNIRNFYNFVFSAGNSGNIGITLYKLIGIALTGAALASCGSVMQGSYRNVMAGPSTTGTMAGGTLGCILYILLFEDAATTSLSFLSTYAMQLCILAGCLAGTGLILIISRIAGRGRLSPSAMLIAGMVFSHVISSVNMVIQYYMIVTNPNDTRIENIRDMMMGSFDRIDSPLTLLMMGVPLVICFVIMMVIRGKLNLLSMGDDEAMASGLNVQRYRLMMMLLGSVMTALTMAFCGRVGFVGFMTPLITRKITGPDMKRIVPCSILTGAILLTVIYDLAVLFNMTDSINVFTSVIGCVLMVITLFRKGGDRDAPFKGRGAMHMGMR